MRGKGLFFLGERKTTMARKGKVVSFLGAGQEETMRILVLSLLASIMMLPAHGEDKPEISPMKATLPEDFSIVHQSWDIGAIPETTDFIEIKKDEKTEGYFLILRQHTTAVDDKPEQNDSWGKTPLTKEQCLAVYVMALKLGFFDLKDVYSTDEAVKGGGGERMAITAQGKTKTVEAVNTDVQAIKALVAKIRTLIK